MLSKFVITESYVVRPNFFMQSVQQDMYMFFIIFYRACGDRIGKMVTGDTPVVIH